MIITVENTKFRNITEASKHYEIKPFIIYSRLKKNWSIEEAFEIESKNFCIVQDKKFKSKRQACAFYGVSHTAVNNRLKKGWSLEEALNLKERKYSNKCKGIIYKIVNIINSKIYIGLTTASLNKRLQQHNYTATVDLKNTKLCRAIRKYGISNFKIEQITKSSNRRRLAKKEIKYIIKYNSINKGYNMVKGGGYLGERCGHELTYKGIRYNNAVDLANYLRISPSNIYRRIKNNITLDLKVVPTPKPKILYRGKIYGFAELARHLNINVCTIKYRLNKNYCLNGSPKMTNEKDYYKGKYLKGVE